MADVAGDWRKTPVRVWVFGPGVPDISFDCTYRESGSAKLNVTENPVETGVVVADHAFMDPLRLEIDGHVGDVTMRTLDPVTDPFGGGAGRRSVVALEKLLNIQSSAVPFIVQTGMMAFPDMVLETLTWDTDSHNAGSLEFHASLRQVITTTTQSVIYPPRKPGKPKKQAAKPVSGGEKTAPAVDDPAKRRSVLKSLLSGSLDDASMDKALGSLIGGAGGLL